MRSFKGGCRVGICDRWYMSRPGTLSTAPAEQKLFYNAIFKAVKRDNSESAAGLQHSLGSFKATGQFVELAIDV